MKLLSVVIPCYNVEKYIDRCVETLVNQTLGIDNMELIFVNDASTDSTFEKLCEWEEKYPESILVVNCEQNGKQGTARNIGITYSNTDYIGFVDSDDWIEIDMYKKMYEKAVSTGVDVVGIMSKRVDGTGKTVEEASFKGKLDALCRKETDRYPGLPGGIYCGLYKKQLIVENEVWFPEGLAYEDNYWVAVLSYYINSWYIIGEPLYDYFVNQNSTIMQRNAMHHFDRLEIEKMKVDELKKRGFFEKDKARIEFDFIKLYYINTLFIIITKMKDIPYDILCQMQRELCERFPDFESNPYLSELNRRQQLLLKTARLDMTEYDWLRVKQAYLKDMGKLPD